ncbi:MAG: phosphotransferase [Cyanobacteria bacterium REEB417]|nr:phosphotransferase [Cyanobacteria bacterium REEB417]
MSAVGSLIGERYRLEQQLSSGEQGNLWRASDLLAGDAAVALRELGPTHAPDPVRERWGRLQGVLHPQVPRLGGAIAAGGSLWLVREWQVGRTFEQLRLARLERQLVFGAGEVLLLLRQLLPVLAVLHSQELVHGDLTPANLLRRDSDGLPVLLDFGLVSGLPAATAGYAPPELARGGVPQPWMDLHALGVLALVLVSGKPPAALLDPVTLAWRWPVPLEAEPELQGLLARLITAEPRQRFASTSEALKAFQTLAMPESTGPVPQADRTVVLVPPPAPADVQLEPEAEAEAELEPEPQAPQLPPLPAPAPPARSRAEEREEAVEGGVWPVVIALVLSAVVGTALGWWFLNRGRLQPSTPDAALQLPSSLPAVEVDQRQQLLNRLRAMQVDRAWFLRLVDASLLAQFPERGGRLPSDAAADAPLRKVWNELAEDWLAKVEQLPLEIRRRLGSFSNGDWQQRQRSLVAQGLSPAVLRQLVSGSASTLLPGRDTGDIPPEPFRQLWFAAAEQGLANLQIEAIEAQPLETRVLSAQVDAGGARLFPIRLPAGHRLVLGVNGSPLMQMAVFSADGAPLESRGPLRVVSLGAQPRSPVQLLVSNEGVAPALITLSLRADPPGVPRPPVAAPPTPAAPPAAPGEPPAPPAPGPVQP